MRAGPKYDVTAVGATEAEADVLAMEDRAATGPVYRWAHRQSPLGESRVFLLRSVGGSAARPVGLVAIEMRRVDVGGRVVEAGLLGDFFVEKAHRTFFPALMLQRAVLGWAKRRYPVTYGFPNASAEPLMRKLAYLDLGRYERHVVVLRHAHYLTPHVRSGALARVAALPFDAMGASIRPAFARGPASGHELETLTDVDARFDRFADVRPLRAACTGRRDATLLRWRFVTRPDRRYTIHALTRTGTVIGYAVVQDDDGIAYVRDLFGDDVATMTETLRLVCGEAYRRGCRAASFRCVAPQELRRALGGLGFRTRPPHGTLVVYAGDAMRGSAAATIPPAMERWYATEGDEDQ